MARVQYHRSTDDRPGYWETRNPALDNIEELFKKSSVAKDRWHHYRVIVQGKPCNRSPEWDEYHPSEAAKNIATYSYSWNEDNVQESIDDVDGEVGDEIFDTVAEQYAWEAKTFVNHMLVNSKTKRCWLRIDFIHIVDIR